MIIIKKTKKIKFKYHHPTLFHSIFYASIYRLKGDKFCYRYTNIIFFLIVFDNNWGKKQPNILFHSILFNILRYFTWNASNKWPRLPVKRRKIKKTLERLYHREESYFHEHESLVKRRYSTCIIAVYAFPMHTLHAWHIYGRR